MLHEVAASALMGYLNLELNVLPPCNNVAAITVKATANVAAQRTFKTLCYSQVEGDAGDVVWSVSYATVAAASSFAGGSPSAFFFAASL